MLGLAAAGVVVEQRRRLGIVTSLYVAEVPQRRLPLAVRGLVLAHQEERLVLVALVLQPVERQVGDDVGRVALVLDAPPSVVSSAGCSTAPGRAGLPEVEAGRVVTRCHLPIDRRLVAGGLEQLGERLLRAVEPAVGVVVEAVEVAVLAGQDRRPGSARRSSSSRTQRSNRIPSLARRSMFGVLLRLLS